MGIMDGTGVEGSGARGTAADVETTGMGSAGKARAEARAEELARLEAEEEETAIQKAPTLELKQCALLSCLYRDDLRHLAGHFGDGNAWDGRLIAFAGNSTDQRSATEINNYFYANDQIKKYYDSSTAQAGFYKDLYYTYLDSNGKAKQVRLNQTSRENATDVLNNIEDLTKAHNDWVQKGRQTTTIQAAGTTYANEGDLLKAIQTATANTGNKTHGDGEKQTSVISTEMFDNYFLESVKIEYNGTNPSTARSDVKVTISFFLESFAALKKSMLAIDSGFNDGSRTDFLLQDLIIAGIGDDSRGGALNALKNIYSPSTNRLRVKVKPSAHNEVEQVPMVLDLAIVDHELARDAGNHGVKLTINYRGYMQQLMQMPYANALMTPTILAKRRARHNNIKQLINAKCSQATLREILRVERSTAELEMEGSFSNILNTLFKYNSIKSWKIKDGDKRATYESIVNDLVGSGKKKTVEFQHVGRALGEVGATYSKQYSEKAALEKVAQEGLGEAGSSSLGSTDDTVREATGEASFWDLAWFSDGGRNWSNCIFFGDLIRAVTDVLYKPNSGDTIKEITENLRFVMFPIHIPDPASKGKFIEVNPAFIPIDLYFFAEWWHEVVVKKELKHYPMAAMIRDLAERLINNLLYEVCISNLLPDETPPMIRVNYFTSKRDLRNYTYKWRGLTGKARDIKLAETPFVNSEIPSFLDYIKMPKPIFPQSYEIEEGTSDITEMNDTHYIVLYVMNPPYRRELTHKKKQYELRNSDFIPTLHHGIYSKAKGSHVDTASFKKTNSPGLREARYFNNSFGSLALMNNVYDLSFTIAENNPSTYLYPGMIINFILTDFSAKVLTEDSKELIDNSNYKDTDNDPHKKGTSAHVLGIGGYFIITRVDYEIQTSKQKGQYSNLFTFNCEAKFLATEADEMVKPPDEKEILEVIRSEKNETCRTTYDEAVRINQAAVDRYNSNVDDDDRIDQQFKQTGNTTPSEVTEQDTDSATKAAGMCLISDYQEVPQAPETKNNTNLTRLIPPSTAELIAKASNLGGELANNGDSKVVKFTYGVGSSTTYTFTSNGNFVTYKETPNATAAETISLN